MSTPDITILGGGIFGLSIAWACLKRGARLRVIEPRKVGAGASGGIVGALAPHTPENWNDKKQFQFESLILARSWWPEIEEASGLQTGYMRSGRLQPIPDERSMTLAKARADSAKDLWRGQATWQLRPATAEPWEPPSPTGMLIHDTLSAHIHPRQATTALAQALANGGAEICETAEAKPEGKIVHATGYEGLLSLSQQLDQQIGNGVKGQALLLRYEASGAPQLFADTLHFIPHAGGTVAIGSTNEREWHSPDQTDHQLDDLHALACRALPALHGAEVIARWAGVRPRAKSRAPMLGEHPVHPGQYVANGGFKIGFGIAPKVAEVMADLLLEDRDMIPEAFKPQASLR